MMTKKKLAEIEAEVARLLTRLPGKSPHTWLREEIESAKGDPRRDMETLEMLCNALDRQAKKRPKRKTTASIERRRLKPS